MAAAVEAVMTAVMSLSAGWWQERWYTAAASRLVCMVVVCLSPGSA